MRTVKIVQKPKPHPYPYSILPVQCPDKTTVEACNPWNFSAFFRVEALLRSKTLFRLYAAQKKNGRSNGLEKRYDFDWRVLQGSHHRYLVPEKGARALIYAPDFYVGRGIVDLAGMAQVDPNHAAYYASLILRSDEEGPRAKLIAIDPARPPEATIRDLRPYLQKLYEPYKGKDDLKGYFLNTKIKRIRSKAHRTLSERADDIASRVSERVSTPVDRIIIGIGKPGQSPLHQTYQRPPFNGYEAVATWLKYLQCYDLRTMQGLSYGDVAMQVYGSPFEQLSRAEKLKRYSLGKKACKRVGQLIKAAETGNWPPPAIQ